MNFTKSAAIALLTLMIGAIALLASSPVIYNQQGWFVYLKHNGSGQNTQFYASYGVPGTDFLVSNMAGRQSSDVTLNNLPSGCNASISGPDTSGYVQVHLECPSIADGTYSNFTISAFNNDGGATAGFTLIEQ